MSRPSLPLAVVGTDTGVGKTLVAGAILRFLRPSQPIFPFKPAETGCPADSPPDGLFLQACAGLPSRTLEDIVPFRFSLPASPLTAAQREGKRLTLAQVLAHYHKLSHDRWPLLEGAGGLLVPFGEDWTFADFLQQIHPRVIVVTRTGLGTMNHTLLTVSELRRRNISILGLVFNQLTEIPGPEERETPGIISRFAKLPILATLPFLPENLRSDPIQAADRALAAFDRQALSQALGL